MICRDWWIERGGGDGVCQLICDSSSSYIPSNICRPLWDVNSWIIKNSFIPIEKTLNHRSIVPFYELQSSRGYFTLFSFILWLLEAFNDKSTTIKHTIKWLQNETPSTHMNVNAPLLQPVRWAYQIIKLAKICTTKRKICKHCSEWGISKT